MKVKASMPVLLLPVFLLLSVLLSCESDNGFADPGYPASIAELSELEVQTIASRVSQTQVSGCSSVDYYGFLFIDIANEDCNIDPLWQNTMNNEEIRQKAFDVLNDFQDFLGLTPNHQPAIQSITTLSRTSYQQFTEQYPDSFPSVWVVTTLPQQFNGMEVRGTNIKMYLSPTGVATIGGKWYNNIYEPSATGLTVDEAHELLMDLTLSNRNQKITITESTTWYTPHEVVVPINRLRKIELHICYALYPEGWEIIIDKYTGEIITSTKIS